MEYLESLARLKEIRAETIKELAEGVHALAEQFLVAEARLEHFIQEFHESQKGYRVSVWWQLDWVIPRPYSSSVTLSGPYLSDCMKEGSSVKKKRLTLDQEASEVLGKELVSAISAYREAGSRLNGLAEILDSKCSLDRRKLPKKKVLKAFRQESERRVRQIEQTIRGFASGLDQIDSGLDEAVFDFNAIEGRRRRYGSFLARWEAPSRIPARTLSGPSGPGVFYIAFTRGKRMSAPIRNLYLRVHQRPPKAETPLTKQMIQKSRLGKFTTEYRAAYKQILILKSERDSVIATLKAVQKRLI